MKEAIGATQIFVICLTFIILFSGYIAISVNYNKAFQVKDYVISKIEDTPGGYTGDLGQEIETYLTAQGYTGHGKCEPKITAKSMDGEPDMTTDWNIKDCIGGDATYENCAVCIYEKEIKKTDLDDYDSPRKYYKAVSFFRFDLPVVNVLLNFQISGTSKYVFTDN